MSVVLGIVLIALIATASAGRRGAVLSTVGAHLSLAKWTSCGASAVSVSKVVSIRGGAKKMKTKTKNENKKENGSAHYTPGRSVLGIVYDRLFKEALGILSPFLPKWMLHKARGGPKLSNKEKGTQRKVQTQEHLEKSFASGDSNQRVQKELRSFMSNPPENCKLQVGNNIRSWTITIKGPEKSVFAGETFKLRINFPKEYPAKPPSVFFLKPTPRHVHVYTNGDICLNLLGRDWRPMMTAQQLVVSIYSMLGSAKKKDIPQDNAMHADAGKFRGFIEVGLFLYTGGVLFSYGVMRQTALTSFRHIP